MISSDETAPIQYTMTERSHPYTDPPEVFMRRAIELAKEAAKLGFDRAIMPKIKSKHDAPDGIATTTVEDLRSLIETLGGIG